MEQLDVLWAQAQRLNRLIDTFVDMNRIERGEFEITRGQVEITSLLKAATSQAGAQHEISMDLPDQPLWVHGDSKRLEQVFSHILSNALRYAPQSQPIRLTCKADAGEGTVTIKVTDRGPGIPPPRLKEIFARKYAGGPLKAGGLGVGLYLSKVIVEAHGGRISIESSSAKGTVVEIVLPV
jgi:signal transduction histidine kinase